MILLLSGCLTLDTMVHSPVHCSRVTSETCEKDEWDRVCDTCEDPYDWQRDYEWMPETLADGETVRPIPEEAITRAPLATDDGEGELDLYIIEGHGENPVLDGITVLYNHGNYAGIEHYAVRVRYLYEAGFDIVAWDYRGYGKSEPPSPPTAEEFLADARQVVDHVIDDLGVPQSSLVLYANSLGAIPATEQSIYRPGRATFLEVPYPGQERAQISNTTLSMPATFLTSGLFENTEKIRDYTGPLLVMGGTEDTFFSPTDLQTFVDNAGGPAELWMLEGVHHGISDGGVPEAGLTAYIERMEDFLETYP